MPFTYMSSFLKKLVRSATAERTPLVLQSRRTCYGSRMSRFAEVALNLPLSQTFTYLTDDKTDKDAAVGKRAEVLFGKRKMTAYIVAVYDAPPSSFPLTPGELKPLRRLVDAMPLFTERHVRLAEWLSRYCFASLGECLALMLPSGRRAGTQGGFPLAGDFPSETPLALSPAQRAAVQGILSGGARLQYLYGTTGSGKTEVFLQLAESVLQSGKSVIYLVPEIALTLQVAGAVARRFGETVAVLHSSLPASGRLREWRRIMAGDARVVVGARSAVFAPAPDLGLIILDEEHDASYKSGSAPRYHARQVAMRLAETEGIPLVMGSATPSCEAWHLMETGIITRHALTERLAGGAPPEIETVDLSAAGTGGGCISPRLRQEIDAALDGKRQTILFLNRRGFTHFFRCNTCGFELKCRNCSVALTLHKAENRLRCHYCGWTLPPPESCPECGSLDAGYAGFGTEFIEAEVRAKFPSARLDRIDADSVARAGELEAKLSAFRNGDTDILLGTQMVAKGLNFPRLKLVGVILADTGLALPDFRAAERTFSLITQVAGRAGRFFPDGKVIVQSFNPGRPAVALACAGRIGEFYREELRQRQLLRFPPFSRLVRLVFRSPDGDAAKRAAEGAAAFLREGAQVGGAVEVLGPAPCPLEKIAANYRMQVLLRGAAMTPLRAAVAALLSARKTPRRVHVEADADPVSLL